MHKYYFDFHLHGEYCDLDLSVAVNHRDVTPNQLRPPPWCGINESSPK